MTLTKSLTSISLAAATFTAVGSFMIYTAETAVAASFTVQSSILFEEEDGTFSNVGNVFGSFDYDIPSNSFSNINLTSNFTGAFLFPAFTTTYNTFVDGSIDTLTAKAADANLKGITLIFPDLDTLALGSTVNLRAGSMTLVSQQFSLSTPLEGTLTAVPTPALLPGLIGMGVAALRRKQEEETSEENA